MAQADWMLIVPPQDGLFTLGEMECMGSRVTGPLIAVADYSGGVEGFSYTYYEDLTPAATVAILSDLAAGRQPQVPPRPPPAPG